jgi:hypothetical protein
MRPTFAGVKKGGVCHLKREDPMAVRQYRITHIEAPARPGKPKLRRNVRARLSLLEDGRELEVSMKALGQVGEVVSLEDDHVHIGLWRASQH